MSRFAGWVQHPRTLLEDVINDRLTGFEHYVLTVLTLLADAATGGDRINAPLLCYYTGQMFNHDTASRLLRNLHESGYIWYRARPYSKKPQPFWVDGYVLTKGAYKLRRINLSQLFDKETISQEDVYRCALQPTEHDTVQPTEHDTDNYKKGKERMKNKKTPSYPTEHVPEDVPKDVPRQCQAHAHVHSAAHAELVHVFRTPSPETPHTDTPTPFTWGDDIPGLQFRRGENAGYYDLITGRRIADFSEVKRLAESGGLTR